jgi:hypothetical protein
MYAYTGIILYDTTVGVMDESEYDIQYMHKNLILYIYI